MTGQAEPAAAADAIWNRAALQNGGTRPLPGDAALTAVLRVHNLAMSGGLLDAVERLTCTELDAAEHGYTGLGYPDAAQVIAAIRDRIGRAHSMTTTKPQYLEHEADQRYGS